MATTNHEARKVRSFRLSDAGHAAVQRIADRDGIDWSTAARRMLSYAAQHMPAQKTDAQNSRAN